MHHHVFDTKLAVNMVEWAGFTVREVEPLLPDHIIVVAEKSSAVARSWRRAFRSPFPSDRDFV